MNQKQVRKKNQIKAEERIARLVPGLMVGMQMSEALHTIADFIESQSRRLKELESK